MGSDGGQSGSLPPLSRQCLSKPNSQICPVEKTVVFNGVPNKIEVAAAWLSRNREDVRGPLLPFLRRKFDLDIIEAIDVSKLAHALEFPGRV